jgi:glyoxalase family protein
MFRGKQMTTSERKIAGIHHITAIVEDPQENLDFYSGVLGLRLVKQTVNFDDPYSYHFYFGDGQGSPGTLVTFFPWPQGRRGARGTGEISAMAFAVPEGSLASWATRLDDMGIRHSDASLRFGRPTLALYDPAGLLLELVETPGALEQPSWAERGVAAEAAIRNLAGATLTIAERGPTAALLTGTLGLSEQGSEDNRTRYRVGSSIDAADIDLLVRPEVPRGRIAAGSVHHLAWRASDATEQLAWRARLESEGLSVTPVRDRNYFTSIYFNEPGGVIFEIATDGPGFAVDEPAGALGTRLALPPWLEPLRENIAKRLPDIRLPARAIQSA